MSTLSLSWILPIVKGGGFVGLVLMGMRGWGAWMVQRDSWKQISIGIELALGFSFFLASSFLISAIYPIYMGFYFWAFLIWGSLLCLNFRPILSLSKPLSDKGSWWFFGLICFFFFLLILSSTGNPFFNINDDGMAYVPLAKKFLQVGQLDDPFSLRRLASYGGQAVFHSLFLLVLKPNELSVWEQGVIPFLMFLLLVGLPMEGRRKQLFWIILSIIFSLYDHLRINLAPQASPAWALLSLLILIFSSLEKENPERCYSPVLIGLMGATLISFRAHLLLFTVLFLGTYQILNLRMDPKKKVFRALIACVLSTSVMAYLLYRSSNTIWFPLFNGNHDPSFDTFGSNTHISDLKKKILVLISFSEVQVQLLNSGLLTLVLRKNSCFLASVFASFATLFLFVVVSGNLFIIDAFRYCEALFLATNIFGLYLVISQFSENRKQGGSKKLRVNTLFSPVVAFCCGSSFVLGIDPAWLNTQRLRWRELELRIQEPIHREVGPSTLDIIPFLDGVLIGSCEPYRFEYTNRRFYHLDIPGNVSPIQPLRFDEIQTALANLNKSGIQWLILEDPDFSPDACILSRSFWRKIELSSVNDYRHSWYPRFLEYFSFFDRLSNLTSREGVYKRGPYLIVGVKRTLKFFLDPK